MKILVSHDVILKGIQPLLEGGAKLVHCPGDVHDEDALCKAVEDVDVILARTEYYTRRVLESAKNLKIISRYGVGTEKIDIQAANELGIWVANTPTALTNAVAEHTILLMLATARRLHMHDKHMREGDFAIRSRLGLELAGKKVAIFGFGRIGQAVAKKCKYGLEMVPLVYAPKEIPIEMLEGFEYISDLDEILAKSDVVSLHLPLTAETEGFCDASFFAKMKQNAIFINAARGLEVDEPALIAALESGKLWGAGLDCFSEEPLPLSSKLYDLENVVMTPHNASATEDSFLLCSMDMGKNVMDVMCDHKKPRFAVNNPPHPRLG